GYDYSGAPTNGSPPSMPNGIPGTYVNPPLRPPAKESYYQAFGGTCTSMCVANYQGGLATDVGQVLGPQGYSVYTVQPATWDGYIYYSACKTSGGSCGLWTAQVDGKGGLASQVQVASTGTKAARQIAAYIHPVTGQPVVFTTGSATSIAVWTHATPGAPLTQLANVPVQAGAIHFRTVASATQVVLNFFVEPATGVTAGDYTIAVSAVNGALSVGAATMISTATNTAELDWYPAAAAWRILYRRSSDQQYYTCPVTP
ncbi:MAG: hypothetical protein JSR21_21735, partial [Proteobacteria bacterium]|nr:hypothetical protein [Pseudomonadota bacterium]